MNELHIVLLCLSLLSVALGMVIMYLFTAQQLEDHYRRLRKLVKKHKHKERETPA